MSTTEQIVLDPPELAPRRAELDLEQLGLHIDKEGADWGESQVAYQLARAQVGAVVTDRHLEPVEMTIPLQVKKEGAVKLAEIAQKLQQKVGMMQADEYEPSWIRRDFDSGGSFAGSVGYMVHAANLHGLQGWLMAHRQHAREVTLKILRSPLCYSMTEVEGAVVEEKTARALQWEITNMLGTAPGLIRLRIKNLNATEHLRALISALESRDHPQDATKETTAKLLYEAEALTLNGGTAKAARTGASGEVARNAALTSGWLTILSSKINGVGHMTHRGVRRVWARIYDPSSTAGTIELRLRFRPLGAPTWSETGITIATPVAGNFALVDLGEIRAELAVLGSQRWEWRLQARTSNPANATIDIDQLYILPVEQFAAMSTPPILLEPDGFSVKPTGTVANDAAFGTQAWTNPENAKASDNAYATCVGIEKQLSFSQYLKATNFGFAIPEGSTITGIIVSVERKASVSEYPIKYVSDVGFQLLKAGNREGEIKGEAYVPWGISDLVKNYGGSSDLWGNTWTPAQVNAANFGVSVGVLLAGNPTASVDQITITVYYSTVADSNRVCFATRSAEIRTDGPYRQDEVDDVWGSLVPEGFNPQAPPSLLEKRAVRGIVIPSQGDLNTIADSGSNKLQLQTFYRPAYHFAREAI